MELIVTEGALAGARMPFGPRSRALLGRDAVCDVRLPDPGVDGAHLLLIVDAGRAVAKDLRSAGGSFVNGVRIEGEAVLGDGDELRIGAAAFRVALPPEAAAGPAAGAEPTQALTLHPTFCAHCDTPLDPADVAHTGPGGEALCALCHLAGCSASGGAPEAPEEPLAVPGRLGPFALERTLGRGGMGVVYRARDERDGRLVALKLLEPGGAAQPGLRQRFLEEARVMSTLDHPGIARCFDLGELDGHLYMSLELIEGTDLQRYRAGEMLPLADVRDWAVQMCRALEYAHGRRVLHRDLKPANALLTPLGQVKIIDYGLSRALGRSGMTKPGEILGTPMFMSPEQLTAPQLVDHRADLYAMGVLLYRLTTRQNPFPRPAVLYALILAKSEGDAPSPRAHRPDMPPALEQVILDAMHPEIACRPASAAELARRLDDVDGLGGA